MENIIKVGVGVMIQDGDKVLLGHRYSNANDTGGIYEPDSWTFPGGKQDYNETIYEAAIREVKEETNLDIEDPFVFSVSDDIQPNKHFVTIQMIAPRFSGTLKVMEPLKEDRWGWFPLDDLPANLYSPTEKFIKKYLKERNK